MRREWLTGEGTLTTPFGVEQREATFTCAHCNSIVRLPPRCNPDDLGGWCRVCDKAICPRCVQRGHCDPFEKALKRMEARAEARKSYEDG